MAGIEGTQDSISAGIESRDAILLKAGKCGRSKKDEKVHDSIGSGNHEFPLHII